MSWTNPTLVKDGHFDPPEAKSAEARLRFDAEHSRSSRSTRPTTSDPARRTPCRRSTDTEDFTFKIKAVPAAHHPPHQARVPLQGPARGTAAGSRVTRRICTASTCPSPSWRRSGSGSTTRSCRSTPRQARRGPFQFPQWFVIGRRKGLHPRVRGAPEDFRLAIEFRTRPGWRSATPRRRSRSCEEHDLPLVCVDMPQGFDLASRPSPRRPRGSGVVRFHGRDRRCGARGT